MRLLRYFATMSVIALAFGFTFIIAVHRAEANHYPAEQSFNSMQRLTVEHPRRTSSWAEPVHISSGSRWAFYPRIVDDANGDIHVLWLDRDEGRYQGELGEPAGYGLWYRKQSNGKWEDPTFLMVSGNSAPDIAVDDRKHVHVVISNLYLHWNGTEWSEPFELLPYAKSWIQIAVDNQYTVHLVWEEPSNKIGYRSYDGSTLSDVAILNDYDRPVPGIITYPDIAIDGDGHPHVVWDENMPPGRCGGADYNTLHTWHDGTKWQVPSRIIEHCALAYPKLTTSPNGTIHFTQFNYQNSSLHSLQHMRWQNGQWETPTIVANQSEIQGHIRFDAYDLSAGDDVHISYVLNDQNGGVRLLHYDNASGNSVPLPLKMSAKTVAMTVDHEQRAHVVWQQGDNLNFDQIYYSTFVELDFSISIQPASHFIIPGSTVTSTWSVEPLNGFDGTVSLTIPNAPQAIGVEILPNSLTPPATGSITFSVDAAATQEEYSFHIWASSAGITHTVPMILRVVDEVHSVFMPFASN